MRYMLLIYNAEDAMPAVAPDQMDAEVAKWFSYTAALQQAGVFIAGDPLQGIDTATTVRVRNDKTLLTDGPFAETKEVLGGFYTVEADDIDAALEVAARIPAARMGGKVEVRPLVEM